jgi:dolichol-phosphate mannosyltransferase
VEMAYLTQRMGYRVGEIPITFEDRRIGQSKMTMGVKIEAAWRVWQLWMRHHNLQPKDRLLDP